MSHPKKNSSHLKYPSGSHFYALSNCTASFPLSQASGEEPPTPFSDRGNEVHGVVSGKIKPELVEEGIREEAAMLLALRNARVGEWAYPEIELEVYREKRLWLRSGMRPIYSGQPDEYVLQQARVYLSDYKTGWHPFDHYVATNCQIRAYVPLIDAELKGEVDEITAAIHKPGEQSPPAVFGRTEIDESRAWALEVVRAATAKGKKHHPVRGAWCRYCSGKVLCPLWREEMNSLAELSSAIASEVPDSMLRALAPKLELARQVAERLLERLYVRVKANPDFFSDWHLEPQSPRRAIADTIEAYNRLVVGAHALDPAEFLLCCRLAVTELEKRVRVKGKLSIHATRKLLDDSLKDVLEYKPSRDQLVYNPKPYEPKLLGS